MNEINKALPIFLFATTLFFLPLFLRGELINPLGLAFKIDPIYQGVYVKGNVNPLLSDLSFEFYSWRSFANQWIKQGIIPFWNPTIYGGLPFVANDQSAVFYPLNILSYLLPIVWQFSFLFFIKILLACFFTYLLVRRLGVSFGGSILSGLVFGFSGFFTVWLGFGITNVAVFLPLVLWAIKGIYDKGFKSWYSLALVFAWTSQLLGGHLETLVLLVPFYAIFIFYEFGFTFLQAIVALADRFKPRRFTTKPPRFSVTRFGWIFGFIALALCSLALSAIQWLPFLEYIGKTAIFNGRLVGSFSFFDFSFLKNLPALVTFLTPNFFGNPINKTFWNPFQNFNEGIYYIGVLPMVFVLVAFLRGHTCPDLTSGYTTPDRSRGSFLAGVTSCLIRFWSIIALLSLLASLLIPPFNILARLPVLSILDFHRFRLLVVFALAILAGFGLDKILKEEIQRGGLRKIGVISLFGGAGYLSLLIAAYYFLVFQKDQVINYLGVLLNKFGQGLSFGLGQGIGDTTVKVQVLYGRLLASFSLFSFQNLLPFLLLISSFLIFFFRNRLDVKKWLGLVLAVVFVDLAYVGVSYQPTVNRHISVEEPAVIFEIKKDQSIFRVAALGQTLIPNSASIYGLQDVRGTDIVSNDYRQFFYSFKGGSQTNLYFFLNEADHKFLDLMNVKYLIVEKGYDFDQTGFEKKGDFGQVELWENRAVWPRALLIQPEGLRDALSKGLEPGKTEISLYTPDEVLVKVDVVNDKSLLVLADAYDSGWQVFVDGQKANMVKAYDILRAVELSKGDHLVKFVYQPWSVVWGIRISVVSLGIFLSLGFLLLLTKVTPCFARSHLFNKRFHLRKVEP